MSEEESVQKKTRAGSTQVTSVSVSEEFQKLIAQYNLSPTECFRRGIAVTLFDLGIAMYNSKKNEERSKYMHEFMEKLEKDEQLQKEYENMKLFENIKKNFNDIKKINKSLEENE